MLPTPKFHHMHLNSIDPDAAIDFYTRQFPSTSKGSWGGFPALKSPNNVMVLFTKIDTPPISEPQSAIWHFGWHVTDSRRSLETYKTPARGRAAAALHERGGRLGADQQRHLAGPGRRARADQGADCRGQGSKASRPAGGGGFAYMKRAR